MSDGLQPLLLTPPAPRVVLILLLLPLRAMHQMKVTLEKMASVDDRIRWMRELWDMVCAASPRVPLCQ